MPISRIQTAVCALAFGMLAGSAGAQTPAAHKPDFSGVWTNASLTSLTRPRGVDELVAPKAEAEKIAASTPIAGVAPEDADLGRYSDPSKGAPKKGAADFGLKGYNAFWVSPGTSLALVKGQYRTSYIVDPANGQLPYKHPEAIRRERAAGATRYLTGVGGNEGPEAASLAERCLIGFGGTGGPGMVSVLYNNTYRFVQTPHDLMILVEMDHDARIIPLFASAAEARRHHKPDAIKPWLGDSVGWWEGDTLVVETINVRPIEGRAGPFVLSPEGKVTERFSRAEDGSIFYQFTVDDPATYTQPWTAELSFRPSPGRVYEYACHEGNYALKDILAGARLKEAAAREAAQTG
jgi:hypothetical protein